MKTLGKDIISDFLLGRKYKMARYAVSIVVLALITASMVLNNIQYLGTSIYELLEWFVYFLVMFGIIPLNIFVLVPRYLLKNRPVTYFILVLILISVTICALGYMQMNMFSAKEMMEQADALSVRINFIASLISMGLLIAGSSSILLFRHWIKSNKRISELETATLQFEMDMLKSQINPHFLFNMLNNANVLIWKNKEEAQRVLYKLEDLLRYQLNESYKDKVLLSFDIRFLTDFLNLEKIRRDNFEFTITKEGDVEDIWVPSLLFIPFVENAVKHNPDNTNQSYVCIRFVIQGKELFFYCENSKPLNKPVKNSVGGLGLKNIQRRLTLLYPDRHTLHINDEDDRYIVTLKLTV